MTLPVILLGAGGHANVVLELLRFSNFDVLGVCDPKFSQGKDTQWQGVNVLGDDSIVNDYIPSQVLLANGLGSLPENNSRKDLYIRYKKQGYNFVTLKHPTSIVSERTFLAEGVQVMAGAIVNPNSQIGHNSMVNTGAIVEHDCVVGEHCHLSPGSVVCGDVVIAEQVHVGAGATVIQGLNIGKNAIVAAGSVLVKDLPEKTICKGVKPDIIARF